MNYVKQRRAFDAYKRAHLKQLSLRMIAAYDALFDAINERGWPQEAAPISKHELLMRFPGSEDTLRRALAELEEIGLITIIAETRRSDAAYTLAQLYEDAPQQESETTQQENAQRKNGAKTAQKQSEFAANVRENDEEECEGENILSLDRARARVRAKQNETENKTYNGSYPVKQTKAEEEAERARRGYPPAGGDGIEGKQGAARAAAAPGCRGSVEKSGEKRAKNAQADAVQDAARACGFSMSKRNKEQLRAMQAQYGEEWTVRALERAALRGKVGLGYVSAILESWMIRGGMDDAGAMAGKANKHAGKAGGAYDCGREETDAIPTYFDMFVGEV